MKSCQFGEYLLTEIYLQASFGDSRSDDLEDFRPELLFIPGHGGERYGPPRVRLQTKQCDMQREILRRQGKARRPGSAGGGESSGHPPWEHSVDAQTQQVMARIAASLVRVQRSRGISTPRLARISKIDQSTLERILRGEDDLQVHTVFVLAAALGVTPVTLLQGIVWIPNAPDGGSFEIEEPDGA